MLRSIGPRTTCLFRQTRLNVENSPIRNQKIRGVNNHVCCCGSSSSATVKLDAIPNNNDSDDAMVAQRLKVSQ